LFLFGCGSTASADDLASSAALAPFAFKSPVPDALFEFGGVRTHHGMGNDRPETSLFLSRQNLSLTKHDGLENYHISTLKSEKYSRG
jgi:hypothetical protein